MEEAWNQAQQCEGKFFWQVWQITSKIAEDKWEQGSNNINRQEIEQGKSSLNYAHQMNRYALSLEWVFSLQMLQKCFWVWLFAKAWQISCQLMRAWGRSWIRRNRETLNKVMRLGKSEFRTYTQKLTHPLHHLCK